MSDLREEYVRGFHVGLIEAEWALFEDRRDYTARDYALREDAASYTAPTPAARRLRAFTLGRCRGYREGAWKVL